MRASVADGAAFSLAVGLGEAYLPAFALAVGLGEITAGLVATVPLFVGAIVQLISPWGVRTLGTYRRWVMACATIQGLSLAPLVIAALYGSISSLAVLLIASLYWAAGMGAGPVWNTWIGLLIPQRFRARFFATRTFATQLAVLVGLIIGGLVLHFSAANERALLGFAALFGAAGLCRLLSAGFLSVHREVAVTVGKERSVSLREFARRLGSGEGRLLTYMFFIQLTSQISAPYFTPYMLRELEFSYAAYVAMLATAFASKITVMPMLGRLADRYGPHVLLWIGGTGVVSLALLWIVSTSLPILLAAQIVAGIVWGAYELGTFLMLFDMIKDEERTSMMTTYTLLNALAILGGSLFGGYLLKLLAEDHSAYLILFGLSTLGRLATLPLLYRITGIRHQPWAVALRTLSVRPSLGSLDTPIVTTSPRSEQEETSPAI